MTHASVLPQSLYDVPALYDRIVEPGPCEAFYDALARRAAGPVLDLACGTGRLTVPLAARGHDIVGLDASLAMLAQARRKSAALALEVPLFQGDMRRFDLPRRFSLVIITCNSLAHLAERGDLLACLSCVVRHLRPGGTVAFDVVLPDIGTLARHRAEPIRIDLGPHPSSAIAVEEIASYDPIRQIRELRWRVLQPDTFTGEIAPLALRRFFRRRCRCSSRPPGSGLLERHADFDGGLLTAGSLHQVCVARPVE